MKTPRKTIRNNKKVSRHIALKLASGASPVGEFCLHIKLMSLDTVLGKQGLM